MSLVKVGVWAEAATGAAKNTNSPTDLTMRLIWLSYFYATGAFAPRGPRPE
jgi:hypothetical protein